MSDAAEEDLEKVSDMLDEASATDTLLESTESVSEGSDGDRPEKASSTKSKKPVPRTPENFQSVKNKFIKKLYLDLSRKNAS